MTDGRKFIAHNALYSKWSKVTCLAKEINQNPVMRKAWAKVQANLRPHVTAGELASSWVLKREKAPQPRQESENKEAIS